MPSPIEARVAAAIEKLSYIPKYAKKMLKEAAAGDVADVSGLTASAFADDVARKYPCHSKEAVYASAVQYTLEPDGRKEVLDGIMKAARVHGIDSDVLLTLEELRQKAAAVKQADAGAVYALPDEGYFRIDNAEDLNNSMLQLKKEAGKLPFRMRFIAARAMDKAASEQGVDTSDYVKQACARAAKSPDSIASGLMTRVPPDHRHRQAYVKAANNILQAEKIGRTMAIQLTAAIDVLDKAAGIHGDYSSKRPTPEELVFLPKEKKASDTIRLSNGFAVSLQRIKSSSLKLDDLAELGSDFIAAVGEDPLRVAGLPKQAGIAGDPFINYARLAAELPNLNSGDARLFMNILRNHSA